MELHIVTNDRKFIVDRFSKKSPNVVVDSPLYMTNDDSSITIGKYGNVTWEQEYTSYIYEVTNRLNNFLIEKTSKWLWSINNLKTHNGEFALLPGRLFTLVHNNNNSITLAKPYLKNIRSLKDQYEILHRFIMCIYHYLNNLYRRLMNPEEPYGIVQRYLSAQACWNLNMFSTSFIVDTFATVDSVNIILGYTNTSCDLVDVHFDVNITAEGNGLGLLGVYLDSTSVEYDPNSYSIQRNFVSADGKEYTFTDITNPNDCKWQFGGKWSKAIISQDFHNVDKQIKCTYIITRNPYVIGYVRYSEESRCVFNVHVKATAKLSSNPASVLSVREYEFNVSCASLIHGYDPEYEIEETT